jgi:predicted GIY-YIG superfamily endonuclease
MTQLLEKYKAYLPTDTGTYSSAKLQDRLFKHYAGSIAMHTQRGQGMSNLVFSDKLSLSDAIAAAGKYKSKFKASEEDDFVTRKIRILFLFFFRGTLLTDI